MERSLGFNPMRWMKGMALRYMPLMITCLDFEGFIDNYLDGELPEHQKMVFELHLKVCRECRDYLAAYRRTMEASKLTVQSDQPQFRDTMPDDLIKAIRAARKT